MAFHADHIVRAAAIHALDRSGRVHRELAVHDGTIIALTDHEEGLDDLVGPSTQVQDCRDLSFTPAFFDTHNHMLGAARDLGLVQLEDVASIDEMVERLRRHARGLPAGAWVVPSRNWHETNLRERRLPTARELDRVGQGHPVALRRGGHVMVANSLALELAGITHDAPDPKGGTIIRDATGQPTGVLIERPAFERVSRLLPGLAFEEQVEQLGRACRAYNQRGITAVREPGLSGDDFRIYQQTADAGALTIRSWMMLRMVPGWTADQMVDQINRWGVRTGLGDATLRLGGVKIFLDGGVEGAALSSPYASDPAHRGDLYLDDDDLRRVIDAAVSRSWEVGCHALGDRAVAQALGAFEATMRRHPGLRRGHLVLEHACFADAPTRQRAVRLGLGVCVQHPLLYFLGGNMLRYWGEARTDAAFPIRSWVEDGAVISAGSDYNITFLNPLLAIWGMVTRCTASAGVRGITEAIDRLTAFELSTIAGAELVGDPRLGPLARGRYADLVAFRADPLACPIDDLPELEVSVTLQGGRPVYDPEGRFDD